MFSLSSESLAGGMGKTTVALLTARCLARQRYRVLLVDADPQSSLTTFCGHEVQKQHPTLLEVLRGEVTVADGIYEVGEENLFLIPSDGGLDGVQDFLAASGCGAFMLKQQLESVSSSFDFCVIDSPPQRSQLCLTTIGAADAIVLPMESSVKGYASLDRTLELLQLLRKTRVFQGHFLGVMPFRDKWIGRYRTKKSRRIIEAMTERVGPENLLPTIRELEPYPDAINRQLTLAELGYPELQYPFDVLISKIVGLAGQIKKTQLMETANVR